MAGYLPQLMDYVTVNPAATIPGRININQASATVLAGIPGMTPEIVEQDPLAARPSTRPATTRPAATKRGCCTEGIVTLDRNEGR